MGRQILKIDQGSPTEILPCLQNLLGTALLEHHLLCYIIITFSHLEKDSGESGKKQLPFNKEKLPAEPGK